MNRRSLSTDCLFPILAAMAVLLMGVQCWLLPLPGGGTSDESLEVIKEADRRAKEQDAGAIVFILEGLYGSTVPGPSLTLEYTLVATNTENPEISWQLDYDRTNWTVKQINSPFVSVAWYDLTQVAMSFEQARSLVLAAGHEDTFHNWTLHQPLFGSPNPIYTFTWAEKTVIVDTVTQAITVIQHEALSGPIASPIGDDSVSRQKIAEATAEVRQTNENAYIIWCGGREGGGNPLNAPGETNAWECLAIATEPVLKAYRLNYDGQWTCEELTEVPFGIEFYDISQVAMDVVEAWQLAVDAGYNPPFAWWTVFKPLNPNVPHPIIVFRDNNVGRYVIVDTVTGEVTTE